MTCLPTRGRAGEDDLGHVRVVDKRRPATGPSPGSTWKTSSGSPASSASSASRSAVSGVSSAGLRTTALPAASAGANPQAAMGIGKFQGAMTPTTPSGSWKVTSMPPGTGICRPLSRSAPPPRSRAGHGRCRPPSGRCRRCARPRAPPAAASSSTWASTTAAKRRSSRARSAGREGRPGALGPARARATAASTSSAVGRGDGGDDLLGGRVEHVERQRRDVRARSAHMRSKARKRSQSVTAASNASSSTRAMLA